MGCNKGQKGSRKVSHICLGGGQQGNRSQPVGGGMSSISPMMNQPGFFLCALFLLFGCEGCKKNQLGNRLDAKRERGYCIKRREKLTADNVNVSGTRNDNKPG